MKMFLIMLTPAIMFSIAMAWIFGVTIWDHLAIRRERRAEAQAARARSAPAIKLRPVERPAVAANASAIVQG
jgi:hypothetical protein